LLGKRVQPLVSIITPTFGRAAFLRTAWSWVESQTYPHVEWLVLDDSPAPDPWLAAHPDPRIRYRHQTERLSIGEKRNILVAEARGELIAHFDDDDYYAPHYLERMVAHLIAERADFVNLGSWYLYDLRHDFFGYWGLKLITGLHYGCYRDALKLLSFTVANKAHLRENHLTYAFSYVYRRALWEAAPFGPVNWNEEAAFLAVARARFKLLSLEDRTGLALHVLHAESTSSCFPQYHLPSFLLPVLFPAPSTFLGALRGEIARGSRH
jgi:glycosyltransferase involved in cell wall biosynthesis